MKIYYERSLRRLSTVNCTVGTIKSEINIFNQEENDVVHQHFAQVKVSMVPLWIVQGLLWIEGHFNLHRQFFRKKPRILSLKDFSNGFDDWTQTNFISDQPCQKIRANFLKELTFCHKFKFSNPYILGIWWWKFLIFQT